MLVMICLHLAVECLLMLPVLMLSSSLMESLMIHILKCVIGNYNEDEINCIAHSSDLRSAFRFDDFEKAIEKIINRLQDSFLQNGNYTCAHADGSLGN